MHMDPELFPNPKEFRPERFLDLKIEEAINPYSYVPFRWLFGRYSVDNLINWLFHFSAGPRNCIGQKYVMLEMKAMITKILQHFEISVAESYSEPILVAEIVLKAENGILLNFKKRE